ncbi:coiled-coil domain-containing protein [Mucilaginibacter ginsenosidivorans]|uniref:Phage tail tape measure protein n=1 Tax=Mucilaginibacter ginsenosidivorans TaxID=398053 RepID=A0A5B8UY65_9SPHI|nr:hypothetical protein [Mucilaginibacter ginsenosidivorans]QEC63336.1 hypothetical protein FRZ54_12375 [Mucilaginibacter ginsenosidivorans]
MADDINKKITVDVQVNTDAQSQVDQYQTAFDNLRISINKLGKPIGDLSKNINSLGKEVSKYTDSIVDLAKQNQEFNSTGEKTKKQVIELAETFTTLKEATEATELVSGGWITAIAAALSVIVTYGSAIADWIGKLVQGETTLSAFNKTLKDNKIITESVNRAKDEGNANAQEELVHLKMLYTAAQDQNLSLQQRKAIVSELKTQYPDYFKNLSDESIMTGKASKAYNDLAASIIASSRARAAEDMMVKNNQRDLSNKLKLEKIDKELKAKQKELRDAKKEHEDILEAMQGSPGGNTYSTGPTDSVGDAKIQRLEAEQKAMQKLHDDINTDSKLLDGQNAALVKNVIKDTEKYGATVVGVTKTASVHHAKAIETTTKKEQEALIKRLQATNDAYAKQAVEENQHYNDEKQRLDKLLNEKYISIEQYHSAVERLESEHRSNISNIIDSYVKHDSAKTQEAQKELVASAMGIKDIENKLAEIPVVAKDIVGPYIKHRTAEELKAIQDRADFEIQTTQKVSDTAFSILSKGLQSRSDAKIKSLENDKAKELSNTSLTSAQKQTIEAKYKKQEDALKLKAFKSEQKASIAQAIINGAIAITKAEAQTGVLGTFVIPAIIAQTAIQVATIAAQKPPAMAKGGYFHSDGKGAVLSGYSRTDNTNAYLRSGEAVVVSEAMRDPWARNLVSAINVAYGGRDFSVPNPSRGYAVGGIFTDGGNANRYYSQPVTDQKNLANTLAYQMINNFPPVYVDVKDINNQQNILAQTVNRATL